MNNKTGGQVWNLKCVRVNLLLKVCTILFMGYNYDAIDGSLPSQHRFHLLRLSIFMWCTWDARKCENEELQLTISIPLSISMSVGQLVDHIVALLFALLPIDIHTPQAYHHVGESWIDSKSAWSIEWIFFSFARSDIHLSYVKCTESKPSVMSLYD